MSLSTSKPLLIGVFLACTVGLFMFAQSASALSGRKLEGSGVLCASGVGVAVLEGDGSVTITGEGFGSIWVKGAEIVRVQGSGARFDYKRGTLFVGWRGVVYASGADMKIRISGDHIEFVAVGTGSVFLVGRGFYRVNGQVGEWQQ
ncbi:MAG: hypothetical protein QW390_01280 [Candidatus Bathyarchaeia archaeon]